MRNEPEMNKSGSEETNEDGITAIQIRGSGVSAWGGGSGYGEKWRNLRNAVLVAPTELTEEFNLGSDLMKLANILPIYYPFTDFKSLKLKC